MCKVQVTQLCLTLCDPTDYTSPWDSPGQNTGVGSLSLLQEIFTTQGSNPGLLHCRPILYQLSHKGSPRGDNRDTQIYLLYLCAQKKTFWVEVSVHHIRYLLIASKLHGDLSYQ